MKKRIWELDALRGLFILGVVAVHFVYDLVELYRILDWEYPDWFSFVKNWGGILFLLISGISATLGSRSVRRGLIVLGGSVIVSGVTIGMYLLGFADVGIIIWFGVLQCLGVCMLLWPLFKKCPVWLLALLGTAIVAVGFYLNSRSFDTGYWLIPFGVTPEYFDTSDYFPLLPNFGFFLLGAVLGRIIYREKETRFPKVNPRNPALSFLQLCGKQSLWIYLLHQPILSGICWLLTLL